MSATLAKLLNVDLSQDLEVQLNPTGDWYLIEKVLVEKVYDEGDCVNTGFLLSVNGCPVIPDDYTFDLDRWNYSNIPMFVNNENMKAHQGPLTLKIGRNKAATSCIVDIYVLGTVLEKQGLWSRIFS